MPCTSDYPAPTPKEIELQRTAKLLIYVLEKTGRKADALMKKTAEDCYANEDYVPKLCAMLKKMPEKVRDKLVYDARNKTSRELADWWEEHQAADLRQRREEQEQKEREKLAAQARMKLTPAERKALGLK